MCMSSIPCFRYRILKCCFLDQAYRNEVLVFAKVAHKRALLESKDKKNDRVLSLYANQVKTFSDSPMVNWRKVKEVSSASRWASVHRLTTWLRWRDNNCMLPDPAPVCLFLRGRRKSSQKLVKQITLVSFSTLSLPPDTNRNRKTGFNVPPRKGSVDLDFLELNSRLLKKWKITNHAEEVWKEN